MMPGRDSGAIVRPATPPSQAGQGFRGNRVLFLKPIKTEQKWREPRGQDYAASGSSGGGRGLATHKKASVVAGLKGGFR